MTDCSCDLTAIPAAERAGHIALPARGEPLRLRVSWPGTTEALPALVV